MISRTIFYWRWMIYGQNAARDVRQNEKPAANGRVGSFEEFLKLDPKEVKGFEVRPLPKSQK